MTSVLRFPTVLTVLAAISLAQATADENAGAPALLLEAKIPLGDVRGRIDHMAVDLGRHRLFVAALGSGRFGSAARRSPHWRFGRAAGRRLRSDDRYALCGKCRR